MAISFSKVIVSMEPRLGIPDKFVSKYKGTMPSLISIQASYGPAFQVEITRSNGEILLDKGLEQFIDYFSIKIGYSLVFKCLLDDSFFHVTIFDESGTETDYPSGTLKDPEEYFRSIRKLQERSILKKSEQPAYKRATAFMSTRPTFVCYMHRAYIVGALSINKCFAEKFMKAKGVCDVVLKVSGSRRTWISKCRLESSSVKLRWKTFVEENGLCPGDACVIEIIDDINPTLKVNIFRSIEDVKDDLV